MFRNPIIWVGCLLLLLCGCSVNRAAAIRPESSINFQLTEHNSAVSESRQPVQPYGQITFADALALALQNNPGLAAAIIEIHSAEARTIQTANRPNPEIDLEFENFGGSGSLRGTDGIETTIALSQQILLSDKRRKQMDVTAFESDLAAWDAERKRLDLYAEVHNAFNRLLITQADIDAKNELLKLSESLLETTRQRVAAGKVSPAEASRAEIVLAQNAIALKKAEQLRESARKRLAATWGSRDAHLSRVTGNIDIEFTLPPEDTLQNQLLNNPDLRRFAAEMAHRKAEIAVADAKVIPDPTVSGGVRHMNESGDIAFVVGLSLPLPIADRNQGNREAARLNLAKSEKEFEAAKLALATELSEAYNAFGATRSEISALREQIIPQAEKAYVSIRDGYFQGRFDFLDVLDAQRTLFESRDRYLHALRELHETAVRIERLIARKIH
ncbi:MAG: TolC family protein [Calditrichia bacterium]